MFDSYYEIQTQNQQFEESLTSNDLTDFNNHRAKVQAFVHFTLTIKDFDEFFKNTPAERKYDHCIYKCYNNISESEFDIAGKETLDKCTNRCKRALNAYKEKKLDIFYLLLMFGKRKMVSCYTDYKNDPYQFYNCNWMVLNKVRRRINYYWYDKLNKYIEAFD